MTTPSFLDRAGDRSLIDALVCFTDITRFMDIGSGDPQDAYDLLHDMATIAAEAVEPTEGRIVKHIGDAMLMAFPGDQTNASVQLLHELQRRLHGCMRDRGLSNRVTFGLHVGQVMVGRMPPIDRPDIFGSVVNRALYPLILTSRSR